MTCRRGQALTGAGSTAAAALTASRLVPVMIIHGADDGTLVAVGAGYLLTLFAPAVAVMIEAGYVGYKTIRSGENVN